MHCPLMGKKKENHVPVMSYVVLHSVMGDCGTKCLQA